MRKPHHSSFVFYAMTKVARQCAHTARQMCARTIVSDEVCFVVLQCRTLCNGNAMGRYSLGQRRPGQDFWDDVWDARRYRAQGSDRSTKQKKQQKKKETKYPKYKRCHQRKWVAIFLHFLLSCLILSFARRGNMKCLSRHVSCFFFCYVSIVVCCCPIKLPLFIINILILIRSNYFLNIIWIKWIIFLKTEIYLDVAGAFTGAGEWRDRFWNATRILENVNNGS